MQAIDAGGQFTTWSAPPAIGVDERSDFQRAGETLAARARLVNSLQRQQRARRLIDGWRGFHIALASLALLIILYHGTMELLSNVFHIIRAT
jgi:hypothetical protein